MPDAIKIRQEITDAIKKKRGDKISENLWKAIENELDLCEVTDGLEGKNNLQTFYNIWKKREGQVGHKNDINSWTCYALGLTSKKPDGEFLVKRRAFARAGFPDIDVDFEDARQNDVFDYLVDKYGRDKGGRIGTHQFLTFKSCITRVTKALDLADAFHKGKDVMTTENARKVSEILSPFPKGGIIRLRGDDGEMHIIKTIKDAYEHSPDFKHYMDKYPLLKKHSFELENNFSAFGIHAAGFVASDIPIEQIAPLRRATKGALATQFTGPELETLGLIKFDILGLSALSVMKRTTELIKENYDINVDITSLPLADEPTFKLYRTGNLGGVFQCEQPGMQHTMREIGVDRFDDIMAGVALYRPGPMDNIPDYVARKRGEQMIDYFHPTIEPFVKKHLERTYGILCISEETLISMQDGSHKKIRDVKIGDKVVSYNKDTCILEGKDVHGCSPTRKCDGYKMTLNNGHSVTLTDDHKVYTWDGMKKIKDLDIQKDIIACPSALHCDEKNADFQDIGEGVQVAYFLGFATGDGSIFSSITLCIGNENDGIRMEQWINKNLPKIRTRRYHHCRAWYISCAGKDLVNNYKEMGVGNRKTKLGMLIDNFKLRKNCYNKRIPNEIFQSSDVIKASYLAGLIDSDGCIFYKNNRVLINYTSVNKDLLEDVRHLSQHLGINCTISGYKVIFNDGLSVLNCIKDFLVLKKQKCYSILKDDFVRWSGKNIFYPKSYLEEKRIEMGLSERAFTLKCNINRSNYRKQEVLSRYAIKDFVEQYPSRHDCLSFYKIKSIEKVNDVQFYGISVEDNHNLLGNGILISNCYQEQIMQICNSLSNFSVTDGYIMIKAIGKKKIDLMNKFEKQFVSGGVANGVPQEVIEQYWEKFIVPFANYGFNASHACCYGYNSYITAYLKANYPDEFICGTLNTETHKSSGNKFDKMSDFEKEFKKKLNVKFLPRDINKCRLDYTIEKKKDVKNGVMKTEIRPSLICKGLGWVAGVEIEKNQPFEGLKDFAERNSSSVDTKAVLALATAGYFGNKPKKDPEGFVKEFAVIKIDLKKLSKKGIESVDLFA